MTLLCMTNNCDELTAQCIIYYKPQAHVIYKWLLYIAISIAQIIQKKKKLLDQTGDSD